MRFLSVFVLSFAHIFVSVVALYSQPLGKLVRYEANENTGPAFCAEGDLLQLSFTFVNEASAIGGIRFDTVGKELKEIGVFRVPIKVDGREIHSKGNISAFLRAEKSGRAIVKITLLDTKGNQQGESREIKVNVFTPKKK